MSDEAFEPFVVKHYAGDEWPIIKGNGFDGIEFGEDREEAERFVAWINERLLAADAKLQDALLEINKTGQYDFKNGTVMSFKECPWAVPSGYVLVPVEPTEEMIDAAYECSLTPRTDPCGSLVRVVWSHMLAAAPKPPVASGGEDEK